MPQKISEKLDLFRRGLISRRELLQSTVWLAGAGVVANGFLSPLGFAAARPAAAEDGVKAETVQYASGDVAVGAYLARPEAEGKFPAVVVIHDEGGLNDQIRSVTRRLAAAGFLAMAPDMLSRAGGVSKMKGAEVAGAVRKLTVDATAQDLKSGFSFLDKHPDAVSGKTSTIGFGWGCWRSFLLAANVQEVYRTVGFYGSTPDDGLSDLESPVLAHYAQFDFRNTGNALWTAKRMKELGKRFTYHVYPQVNYGFCDDTSPDYNGEAAKLAWTRTLEFLKA